ncbi:HAD-IA family hydrolase [Cognatishimia sp.]|uniref:HAD-IA family hydrolase n=1 Tax=Cognatishimia sp. TaxID=2211648 RepID=UPI003513058F|nr:HAD-IA family hydrolase [Cognatishimia sp.]
MSDLRLVIFDVDGTLVDSQGDIVGSMSRAFAALGKPAPARENVLSIVGLSLDVAMQRLAPEASLGEQIDLVDAYKQAYQDLRAAKGSVESSPLYPGARQALDALRAQPYTLLGVATGKSRRGLDSLIAGHTLEGFFVTEQVADHHPSKPHPSMIEAAIAETGVGAAQAVMIGDTSFDMSMARAAGVRGIGVSWGYHSHEKLADAEIIIDRYEDLLPVLDQMLG